MNRPERMRVPLLLTVVTALLLAACSGADSDAAKGTATPSAPPTPSATPSPTPTPSPTTAAEIAEAVKEWYAYGGETAMVSLIKETVKAQSGRPRTDLHVVIVDFEDLMDALDTARLFTSLPDPKTRTAWAAAIEHLDEGARAVLDSVPKSSLIQSPEETWQMTRGWRTFDEGTKSLKAAQSRLHHAFGLKPSPDPWAAS